MNSYADIAPNMDVSHTRIRQVSRRAPVYPVFRAHSYAQAARVAIRCADRKCLLVAMKPHLEPCEQWYRAALVSSEFAHLKHAVWADANIVLYSAGETDWMVYFSVSSLDKVKVH